MPSFRNWMTDLDLSTTYQLFELAHNIITLHVVKTFKMYFLSNFQVYNTVLLTRVTMVFIRFPWPYTPYTSLYPSTNISTSPLPACSRHHMLTLCFYEFGFIDTTCKTDCYRAGRGWFTINYYRKDPPFLSLEVPHTHAHLLGSQCPPPEERRLSIPETGEKERNYLFKSNTNLE